MGSESGVGEGKGRASLWGVIRDNKVHVTEIGGAELVCCLSWFFIFIFFVCVWSH